MKLQNKKNGEIGKPRLEYNEVYIDTESHMTYCYKTLDAVFDEWKVLEEPKGYWYYDTLEGGVEENSNPLNSDLENDKAIGNYFETKEEAEKAVRKLKAWKRLKDKKIFIWLDHFDYRSQDGSFNVEFEDNLSSDELNQVNDDLDLIFGGGEE